MFPNGFVWPVLLIPRQHRLCRDLLELSKVAVLAKNTFRKCRYGYEPQTTDVTSDMLVRFAFKNFQYRTSNSEPGLANWAVEATLMPVFKKKAKDGGMLPDSDAIGLDFVPPPRNSCQMRDILPRISMISSAGSVLWPIRLPMVSWRRYFGPRGKRASIWKHCRLPKGDTASAIADCYFCQLVPLLLERKIKPEGCDWLNRQGSTNKDVEH